VFSLILTSTFVVAGLWPSIQESQDTAIITKPGYQMRSLSLPVHNISIDDFPTMQEAMSDSDTNDEYSIEAISFCMTSIAWKPDGAYALIAGDWGVIWKFDGLRFTTIRWEATLGSLADVAWKPDGTYALIVGPGGIVKFDETTATEILSCSARRVAWKPDGTYALVVGENGAVWKYDETSLTLLGNIAEHWLEDVAWKPDGEYAVIVGENNAWKYDETVFTKLATVESWINFDSVAWKPDGTYALIVGDGIWKFDGNIFAKYRDTGTMEVAAWKPDGTYALIAAQLGGVWRFDELTFTRISTFNFHLNDIAWTPIGTHALMVGIDHAGFAVYKFDESVSIVKRVGYFGNGRVSWEPDGSSAIFIQTLWYVGAVVGPDFAKFDGDSFTLIEYDKTYWGGSSGHRLVPGDIAWKPDGSYALIIGYDNFQWYDNLTALKCDGSVITTLAQGSSLSRSPWTSTRIAWKPDGTYALIVADYSVWKFDGTTFTELLGHDSRALNVAWKPDGTYALVVGENGAVWKYDGEAFTKFASETENDLTSLAWKPNGRYALIAGYNGTLLKFNGTILMKLETNTTRNFNDIAWKPQGNYCLLVGNTIYYGPGGDVFKFDGTALTKLEKVAIGLLNQIVWSPDGSVALIAGSYTVLQYSESTSDSTSPIIQPPSHSPSDNVPPNQDVRISVYVADFQSGVKNVTLSYVIDNGTSGKDVEMNYDFETGFYEATIPGQTLETRVEYQIMAYDNAENKAVENRSGEYYGYDVIPEFPSPIVLPLFIVATLLAVIAYRRKR